MINNNADSTHTQISVRAPARLHLGFLDLNGTSGRKFGSIGLSVNSHYTHIVVTKSDTTHITGQLSDEAQSKLEKLLAQFYSTVGQSIPATDRNVLIDVIERIPEHSGLGSGTQLALVLGTALCRLYHINISTIELAAALGRGKRSGIGIATFDQGGFVIDGGSAASTAIPPVLARHPFPDNWHIVLVQSPAFKGIHGKSEKQAFKTLPLFPLDKSQAICHLTLMQLLPALKEQNLHRFGEAVTQVQALIGDHFAPMQGGRYTSQGVANCLLHAQQLGYQGIAQSSWGPTGCIFTESAQQAEELIKQLQSFSQAQSDKEDLYFINVQADNIGAIIEKHSQ